MFIPIRIIFPPTDHIPFVRLSLWLVRFCLSIIISVFSAIIATIAGLDQAQQQRSNVNNNGAIHFPSEDQHNSVRRTAFSQNPLMQPHQISNTAIKFPSRQAPQTMNFSSMPAYQPMNAFQSQNNGIQSPVATSLQQSSDIIDCTWELFQVSKCWMLKYILFIEINRCIGEINCALRLGDFVHFITVTYPQEQ